MKARGITATSGRQLRSCEGGMAIHHATTPAKTRMKATRSRRRGDNQSAQTANAAKTTASPSRNSGHGRFE
jgi:hypothetical protein